MKKYFLCILCMFCSIGYAEEGEMQIRVSPTLSVHSSQLNPFRSYGMSVISSYDLKNWLSFDAEFWWQSIQNNHHNAFKDQNIEGQIYYNASRFNIGHHWVVHKGVQNIFSLGLGAIYQIEQQSDRTMGSLTGVYLRSLNKETYHALMASSFVGYDHRFLRPIAIGFRGRILQPVIENGYHQMEFSLSASISVYWNI